MEHEGKIIRPKEQIQFTPEVPLTTFPDLLTSLSLNHGFLQEAIRKCLAVAQKRNDGGDDSTLHHLEALQAGLQTVAQSPERLALFAIVQMDTKGQVKKRETNLIIAPQILSQRPAVIISASKEKKNNEKGRIDISEALIDAQQSTVRMTGGISIEKDTRVISSGTQARRRKVAYLKAGCFGFENGEVVRDNFTNQLTGIVDEFDSFHRQIHTAGRQLAS